MTEAVSDQTVVEKDRPLYLKGGFWGSVFAGMTTIAAGSGMLGHYIGQSSRDIAVARAETLAKRNTDVAIALGRAGFTNLVAVETSEYGQSEVTLSIDPTDQTACRVTFHVSPDATSISLGHIDAAGREFSRVTASNGQEAQKVMTDLCT